MNTKSTKVKTFEDYSMVTFDRTDINMGGIRYTTTEYFWCQIIAEDKDNLLYTNDFNEVIDFVNKPTLYGLIGVLEEHFNYGLPFRDWKPQEQLKFIRQFLTGETEYYINDQFPTEIFIKLLQNAKMWSKYSDTKFKQLEIIKGEK